MAAAFTSSGTITASAAQFTAAADVPANLHQIADLTACAKGAGADLVVFPEAAMFEWAASGSDIARAADEHGQEFGDQVAQIAATEAMTIVAGAFLRDEQGNIRNSMLAYGPEGRLLGRYDKIHLYDAFHYRESDKITAARPDGQGGELALIPCGPFTFGLVNCYDLRFPEFTRALIDAGANSLLVSSAWVSGEHKALHWETLLRARAIENTVYIAASNQPGPGSVGLSMVMDPMGLTLDSCGTDEAGLATGELRTARLDEVRATVPSLQHRRYDVVPRLAS